MKTMAAAEFKAHCLQVMEQVHKSRQPVTITKRGRPIAKLVPVDEGRSKVFDSMKGKIEILGDIVGPVTPLEDWEALK
jgi:prevent-host-death family protein